MHGSRSKILMKNLVRQCCTEEFDSGVKELILIKSHKDVALLPVITVRLPYSVLNTRVCGLMAFNRFSKLDPFSSP
jgi:hypothetical protein